MEDSTYTIEYIDRYLSGDLSKEEVQLFEKQMEEDAELKQSVQEVIRAKAASYLAGREKWVGEMNQKFDQHLGPRRFNFWPLLLAAVVAIFLVLTGLWWFQQKNTLSPGEIYAQVYTVPGAPEYRGDAQDLDSLLAHAYTSFNSKAYEEALSTFDILLSREDLQKRGEVLFFKGIALLETEQNEDALTILSEVTGAYEESAQFYSAITLLKRGEISSSRAALQELIKLDGTLKSRAEEVLKLVGE